MMNQWFGLYLVCGWSIQILIASQLVTTAENSTALVSPQMQDIEQSSRTGAIAANNTMTNLDAYKWKKRLLLVFAPKEDAAYQRQMQLFAGQQAGFKERDLLVVQLLAEGTSRIDGQTIDAGLATEIRKRFNVEQQEFQLNLVGKDGTSKRRDQAPVPPVVIFNEIDAMPMRQQEMQQRSN